MQYRSRGPRPRFFDDPQLDRFHVMLVALIEELAVAHERQDTLERLLEAKGVLTRAEIETFQPDESVFDEREAWRDAYVERVLRVVFEEAARLREGQRFETVEDVVNAVSSDSAEVAHARS